MSSDRPQTEEKPTAAFVLSLIAGLWMVAMGGWMPGWPTMGGMMGAGGGWMWGHGVMGFGGTWQPWLGLIAGIVVLVGAVVLYSRPRTAPTWGIVIVVVSALNLFVGMGGFLASLLGLVGGALAAAWRPQTA